MISTHTVIWEVSKEDEGRSEMTREAWQEQGQVTGMDWAPCPLYLFLFTSFPDGNIAFLVKYSLETHKER